MAELQKLLVAGITERVNASPWISNLVMAKKKSGSLQPCIDLRMVNKVVIPTSIGSASLMGALLILLIFYFILSSTFHSKKCGNEPPGPTPLPLLGNMLQLDMKNPSATFLEFAKKYGSVFTVYLGPQKVVMLAGYKTVKEALVDYDEIFRGRDILQIIYELSEGKGITWSNGDSWKEMRRFAMTNLRDFGMGKKACEDKIIEESHHLNEVFHKFKGEAFDPAQSLAYAVSNIISSIVYGSRFEYDDPEFTSLVDRTCRRLKLLTSTSVMMYNWLPWLFKWVANRKEYHRLVAANIKHNLTIFSQLKETLNPQKCRCFVDAFLVRKQKLEESGIINSNFHDGNLVTTVRQLFSAGTETTSTTLRWALLLMAKYPQIQDQVQEELRDVIGDRQVQVADRKNLPFTNAVIHEIQRLISIAPSGLPHKTTQDVIFQGHFIKEGTTVYAVLTSVLHDPDEWERPHSFYPAHFLDKDKKFVKRDAFMPFSAGGRICLGENLARMELFIFFTTLLQHFRFTPAPGVSEDELDLISFIGVGLSHPPYKVCAVSRMETLKNICGPL
ncbi:cytochrome P450 2K1-like [Pholidichthys leucotaenia]